jgi:pimeloyl-ACP methyl ester carboxylesterase
MTRFATARDGVRLAYETIGDGKPIVLVHGFASSRAQNWRETGWYKTLNDAGYAVTAMDCRGHGESDKPRDDESYGDKMVADIATVMDAAGLERADVMGYSMGARVTAFLALAHPERVRAAVLGGLGDRKSVV